MAGIIEGQIVPATPDELEKEISAHGERIQAMLAELNEFQKAVLNGQ